MYPMGKFHMILLVPPWFCWLIVLGGEDRGFEVYTTKPATSGALYLPGSRRPNRPYRTVPLKSPKESMEIDMGVSKNSGGPPKWMVYNEKPY